MIDAADRDRRSSSPGATIDRRRRSMPVTIPIVAGFHRDA